MIDWFFFFKSFPIVTFLDIQLHWHEMHLPLIRKCLANCEHLQLYLCTFHVLSAFMFLDYCFLLFRFYFLKFFANFISFIIRVLLSTYSIMVFPNPGQLYFNNAFYMSVFSKKEEMLLILSKYISSNLK